jgi:O-antigen/teichoic acid export membrane protein
MFDGAPQGQDIDTGEADVQRALKGLFGRDAGYMVLWGMQLVLAAALTPVTTRLLGPREFGRVSAGLAVMQLVAALLSFGLQTAIQRAYAGSHGETHARRLVAVALAGAAFGGILIYATGNWWAPAVGLGPFPISIQYAVVWGFGVAATAAALSLIRSKDKLGAFAVVTCMQSVVAEALAVGLVASVGRNASNYFIGQLIGQGLALAFAVYFARPRAPKRRDIPLIRSDLAFALPLIPTIIAGFVIASGDRLVIQGDLGAHELGKYTVATNIGGFASTLMWILVLVWLPRIFAITDETLRREVVGESTYSLQLFAVLFALTLTMAAPLILLLWVPASYDRHSLEVIVALMAVNAVVSADTLTCSQLLVVAGRTAISSTIAVVCAVANLGLNLLLVPSLGIDGAAVITLATTFLSVALVRLVLRADAPPLQVGRTAKIIASSALCMVAAELPDHGWFVAVRVVVALAAMAAFARLAWKLLRPVAQQSQGAEGVTVA